LLSLLVALPIYSARPWPAPAPSRFPSTAVQMAPPPLVPSSRACRRAEGPSPPERIHRVASRRRQDTLGKRTSSALPRSPLRKADRHAEPDGGLGGQRGVASIRHPLSAHEQVQGRRPRTEEHVPEPEAERYRRRGAVAPVDRPAGVGRFRVQPPPEVPEHDRLERQGAD